MEGFVEGLHKYPDENNKYHNALVIKGETYPGYEGYDIHQGTEMEKAAKNCKGKLRQQLTT